MKVSRINKTVTVDPFKITLFDDMKYLHGFNISDFIDVKLSEFLTEISPDEMHKQKIRDLEAELFEAKNVLPEIEFNAKQWRQQSLMKAATEQVKQNSGWLEKYELSKDSTATLVNRKFVVWKDVADNWGFDNAKEAEEKVTEQLKKDNLFGCKVCNKCNHKTQYCSTYRKVMEPYNSCQNWIK